MTMATVQIPDEGLSFSDPERVAAHLATIGVDFERWSADRPLAADASADEVLAVYADDVERLKASGGYATADVVVITPATPGLEEMLAKFRVEHTHDDDEVRFVVAGRGVFHLNPDGGPVTAVEVETGDLLRVPAGTRHWFDLCADRSIRVIRLFKDPAGWVPRYTASGAESRYEPVCLGVDYFRLGTRA
jgi:1,2-dihydroxy-3-keto-5-methylthiopentene dioxygenase